MMKKLKCVPLMIAAALSLAAAAERIPTPNPVPRARDGKPNLSGIWQTINSANFDLQDHSAQK